MRRFSTDCTTALLWTPRPGAVIAQKVENVYFGKPCGLMDQMASSVGGMVTIDFKEQDAKVEAIACDFAAKGYALCVVNTGGDHGDLTDDYAAIRKEMEAVAAHFGKHVLREVELETVESHVGELRRACGDRAVLRALHYYDENARVLEQAAAIRGGDLARVFRRGEAQRRQQLETFAECLRPLNGRTDGDGHRAEPPFPARRRRSSAYTAAVSPERFRPMCRLTGWMTIKS